MSTIQRIITSYYMELELYKGRNIPSNYSLKTEFENFLSFIDTLNQIQKKKNDKSNDKIYFLDKHLKDEDTNIYKLTFISAKYNHVREVINTENLKSKGTLKTPKDGDKEKTHISIYFEDESTAICLLENNYYGIGKSKIEQYINEMLDKYYKSKDKTKFYRINMEIIPNDEFLKELSNMNKISVVKFTVDKEELKSSDFRDLSGRTDVKRDIEIIVKPTKGSSLTRKMIKDYLEKKNKNEKIKRIKVEGSGNLGKIYLDTEVMKTKHYIKVETENITGEIRSDSIFEEFKKILIGED